jgi:hypothetical protein
MLKYKNKIKKYEKKIKMFERENNKILICSEKECYIKTIKNCWRNFVPV